MVVSLTISLVVLPIASLAKEDFPNKQVELVVSYTAGGSTDLVCRALGESAKRYLGQPVIVVNKPGGGSSIGTGYVYNAKPDGYTLYNGPHQQHLP